MVQTVGQIGERKILNKLNNSVIKYLLTLYYINNRRLISNCFLQKKKETSRGMEMIFLNLENEERSLAMWVMLVVLKYSVGQE